MHKVRHLHFEILQIYVFVYFAWEPFFLFYNFRWTRPSGSDSDTDEEPQHASSAGPPAAVRSASYLGGGPNPVSNSNSVSNANNTRVRPHPLAAQINSTPSPQLSLAEFLQDGEWVIFFLHTQYFS